MSHLQVRALHRGDTVAIRDVTCRAPRSTCGSEERVREHSMIFTRRGTFVVHRDARDQRTAEPLHVLFCNAGETHRVSHPTDGGDACTVLDFPEEIAREASRRHSRAAWSDGSRPFPMSCARATPNAVLELHALRQRVRAGADPLDVEERALTLLDLVLRDAPTEQSRERRSDRSVRSGRDLVDGVLRQIAGAPHRKHTLAALAAPLCISPYHLARRFRSVTGLSIHQHVVRARLALALDRLADSSMTLSEIAAEVGFSSHGHLTSAFRQIFGLAPSSLRQRWRALPALVRHGM